MKKMTNIIIGCGGSGAKIAVDMAELMGQDPSWRHDMDENIYFMLLDTDRGELEYYSAKLRRSAPDIHVSTILSTSGYQVCGEILDDLRSGVRTGNPETDRAALKRFMEHWWCANDSAIELEAAGPFRVPKVFRITTGAAQVPMVSYLAVWGAMKSNPKNRTGIEEAMKSLCDAISRRRVGISSGNQNPLEEFNIFFVGSLAGGTGRGALIPLAFKLKEVFYERFGRIPFISAYLMDQSCFAGLREAHEELPQMMNSMTGWSEISGWMSYYDEEVSSRVKPTNYGYSLPGYINMHDPANDVLRSLLDNSNVSRAAKGDSFGLDRARLPFDAVGIVGRQSASDFTAESTDQLYQMIATSMYVRLTQSKVDSKISNEGRTYFSVGSSVTKVPYQELENFFNRKAALDAAHLFTSDVTSQVIDGYCHDLLKTLGFADPLGEFLAFDSAREITSHMEAFAKACVGQGGFFDDRLADLSTALNSQNPASAEQALAGLLCEEVLEEPSFLEEVAAKFVDAYCSYDQRINPGNACESVAEMAESVRERVLHILAQTGSARAAEQLAIVAASRIKNIRDSTLSQKGIEQWFVDNRIGTPAAASVHEKAKKREGFLGMTGSHYTEDEIIDVLSEAKRELAALTLRALGRAFGAPAVDSASGIGFFTTVLSILDDARNKSSFLTRCASFVSERMNISIESLRDERKNLFASDNPANDVHDGAGMHILRQIRPVFPSDKELILNVGAAKSFAEAVIRGRDASGKVIDAPSPKTEPVDKEEWLHKLEEGFKSSRYECVFAEGTRPRNVMEKFRLANVLRDLASGWRRVLQNSWDLGDKDLYYKQHQLFRNFFGIEPRITGNTVEISGGDEYRTVAGDDFLMLGLAAASARTCRPFWRTVSNAERSPHLIVQIPVSIEPGKKNQWEKRIKEEANMPIEDSQHVNVISNSIAGSETEHNPYILAVYTSTAASKLDQVTTLDAWRKNATLLQCLRLAEDMEGKTKMPFNTTIESCWDDYRGSGFSDPSYVYRPELRRNRWRPWVSKEEQERERQEDEGSKAGLIAVYACLGPKWYLNAALGATGADEVLKQSGIPGEPIFKEADRKMFKLGRLPVVIGENGKASVSDADIKIGLGSNLTQSIRTIPEVLAGKREARSNRGSDASHLLELGRAVEAEYLSFLETAAEKYGFHHVTSKIVHLKLLAALKDRVIEERGNARPNQEDGDHDFWQGVLEAVSAEISRLEG